MSCTGVACALYNLGATSDVHVKLASLRTGAGEQSGTFVASPWLTLEQTRLGVATYVLRSDCHRSTFISNLHAYARAYNHPGLVST